MHRSPTGSTATHTRARLLTRTGWIPRHTKSAPHTRLRSSRTNPSSPTAAAQGQRGCTVGLVRRCAEVGGGSCSSGARSGLPRARQRLGDLLGGTFRAPLVARSRAYFDHAQPRHPYALRPTVRLRWRARASQLAAVVFEPPPRPCSGRTYRDTSGEPHATASSVQRPALCVHWGW